MGEGQTSDKMLEASGHCFEVCTGKWYLKQRARNQKMDFGLTVTVSPVHRFLQYSSALGMVQQLPVEVEP